MHVPRDRLAALLLNAGEAPLRIASQMAHEIERMRAEDHQVLAAAALVLLAVAAQFEEVADLSLADQFLDDLDARAIARLVRQRDLDVVLVASRDHLIGLLQRLRDRLFEENTRAML